VGTEPVRHGAIQFGFLRHACFLKDFSKICVPSFGRKSSPIGRIHLPAAVFSPPYLSKKERVPMAGRGLAASEDK